MKKLIPFLLAILLLTGCSTAAVERPNTPIPPTATVAPTSTATPTSLPPTATPEVTTCTFGSRGYLMLPGGEERAVISEGWTGNDEYYVGTYAKSRKANYCFLEKGYTGPIKEFSQQTEYYADNVPAQVLEVIGKENLCRVFPSPDNNRFLFTRATESSEQKRFREIGIWDHENEKIIPILIEEEQTGLSCAEVLRPGTVYWLDNTKIFIDCGTSPTKMVFDIPSNTLSNNITFCFDKVLRGFLFSPDGKYLVSVDMRKYLGRDALYPLIIAETQKLLQCAETYETTGNAEASALAFIQTMTQTPFSVRVPDVTMNDYHNIQWASDSQYLFIVDHDMQHETYGDILKYHVATGNTETIIEFDRLKNHFPEIEEKWYSFEISPSEEYLFIGYAWPNLHILPISDLQ